MATLNLHTTSETATNEKGLGSLATAIPIIARFTSICKQKGTVIMGTTSTQPVTQAQLRKIYAEARDAGLDNDYLHELIRSIHGKESLKELEKWEAAMLIDALVEMNGGADRPGMITERQAWMLAEYQLKLGWTDERMRRFVKKYGHVEFVHWLTKQGASKIIEALKNIHAKQPKEEISNAQ